MKKNKRLMVIVGSLLLAIGISFAYFVSSVILNGNGSSTEFTIATIQSSELKVEGSLSFNDLDIYPGHKNVSSIKITATGDNELIPYNLIWNGTNTLNTTLNYTVYKTSSEISVSASCNKIKGVVDGALMYYEECSITNQGSLGTPIASGTINKNETKVTLVSDEFITSTSNGTVMYYYVILEYPNLEENQNSDIGGSFNGKVTVEKSDAKADINIIAAYIEQEDGTYEEVSDIPQSGYVVNAEKSVCSNGANVRWENNELITSNLTKSGTECYLYFDKQYLTAEILLSNYSTVLTRDNFTTIVAETTTGTIYKSKDSSQYDDYGEVYYFAGNPTDNWVRFAGFYWRIIRINGDGTIRMIYQGTSPNTTGEGTQIGTSAFNSDYDVDTEYNNNMYVGYMYTNNKVHGLENDSTIKRTLDTWFRNKLLSQADKISLKEGFCGDRQPSTSDKTSNGKGGTGTTFTYYGAYIRLITNKVPTFKCTNDSDLYTTIDSSRGNKTLYFPIGLITADEVAYAGGLWLTNNSNYYLYTNQVYWTMSPLNYSGSVSDFIVDIGGDISGFGVENTRGVRPVINLKASVTISNGNGTSSNPYIVE